MVFALAEFYKNKTVFSAKEEKFKKDIELHYGIHIKQTLFAVGGCVGGHFQKFIYIWIDSSYNFKITKEGILNLQNNVLCEKSTLISSYYNAFEMDQKNDPDIYITIFDFKKDIVGYAHGNAIRSIKNHLQKKYNCEVYLDYSKMLIVLEGDQSICDKINKNIQQIKEECLCLAKKYDNYGIVDINDIYIRVVDKNAIDPSEKIYFNNLHMINAPLYY